MTRKYLALALFAALLPLTAHAAPPQSPEADAFKVANMRMMKDMDVKPTGDADRDFAAMMIPHHKGAIEMAKAELEYGHDEQLRELAAKIIRAQKDEIGEMQRWQEGHK